MGDEGELEQRWAATLAVIRDALHRHDLAALGAVLAGEVRWHGCRTREDVLAAVRERLAVAPVQVRESRLVGDRAILRIELPGAPGDRWFALALDERGLICELLDCSSEAALQHDLGLLARGLQPAPGPAVAGLVPFVHVADMARSVAFYALLGFEPVSTYEPQDELVWAFMRSGNSAKIMLARAGEPIDAREQAVLFYLYAEDLAALRDHLVGHGVAVGEISDGTPAPKQQMRLSDPDGYVLMIAQIEPDA